MTKIYLVRHCEAEGNAKRLFQGSTDCDISELGAKQLEFLSERFKEIELDRVFTSPLLRAKKTAQAVAKGKDIEIEVVENLREINGGCIDGKPFEDTFNSMPELRDAWYNHPQDFAPQGGEPMRAAYERIWNTILEIAKKSKGQTVAAATHGGVIRCLLCRLTLGSIEKLSQMSWSDNTAVTLLEFDDDGNCNVEFINDVSHLPREYIPVRIRLLKEN